MSLCKKMNEQGMFIAIATCHLTKNSIATYFSAIANALTLQLPKIWWSGSCNDTAQWMGFSQSGSELTNNKLR